MRKHEFNSILISATLMFGVPCASAVATQITVHVASLPPQLEICKDGFGFSEYEWRVNFFVPAVEIPTVHFYSVLEHEPGVPCTPQIVDTRTAIKAALW